MSATNIAALRERTPESDALRRYGEIAGLLTNGRASRPEDVIPALRDLVEAVGIPNLATHGITRADLPAIAAAAANSSSMKANPLVLTAGELTATLEAALGG